MAEHTHLTSTTLFRWWCHKTRKYVLNTPATPQIEWTHLGLCARLFEEATSFFKGKKHCKHLWSLLLRCIIVRYVTSHSRGKTIYYNISLSMQRKNPNRLSVVNDTFEMINWKSIHFVITHMKRSHLPKSHWTVHIAERCLDGHSTLDVTSLYARKRSVEPTRPDMEGIMLEMTSTEREYHQKLEVGKAVSTLLHLNEHLPEESLTDENKGVLKLYGQSQIQYVSVHENATLKPWQKQVRHSSNSLPIGKSYGL